MVPHHHGGDLCWLQTGNAAACCNSGQCNNCWVGQWVPGGVLGCQRRLLGISPYLCTCLSFICKFCCVTEVSAGCTFGSEMYVNSAVWWSIFSAKAKTFLKPVSRMCKRKQKYVPTLFLFLPIKATFLILLFFSEIIQSNMSCTSDVHP